MENRYEIVKLFIRDQIETAKLNPGSKLPSIRNLAEKLNVCNSTVINAYRKLEQENIIYSVPKSGYYIIKPKNTDVMHECHEIANLSNSISSTLPHFSPFSITENTLDMFPYRGLKLSV